MPTPGPACAKAPEPANKPSTATANTTTSRKTAMPAQDSTTKPTAEQVTAFREEMQFTKAEAARMVGTTWRTWQQWEAAERAMPTQTWALLRARMHAARGNTAAALAVLAETSPHTTATPKASTKAVQAQAAAAP